MLLIRLRQPSVVSTVSLPSNPGPANSQQALQKRPRRRAPARVWASWAAGRDAKGDARGHSYYDKDRPAVNQPAGCSDRRRGSKILRHLATPVQVAVRGGDAQSAGSRERHPPRPHTCLAARRTAGVHRLTARPRPKGPTFERASGLLFWRSRIDEVRDGLPPPVF